MVAMVDDSTAVDARTLCRGSYSAWLKKTKSEGGRGKWLSSTNKRFFTIDFDARIVFYAHSADQKKVSQPIKFKDIVGAERMPSSKKKKGCGFVINTMDKTYELYTNDNPDAVLWVHALNAGRDMGSDSKHQADSSQPNSTTYYQPQGVPTPCRSESKKEGASEETEPAELDTSQNTTGAQAEEETTKAVIASPQLPRAVRPKVLPSLGRIEEASPGKERREVPDGTPHHFKFFEAEAEKEQVIVEAAAPTAEQSLEALAAEMEAVQAKAGWIQVPKKAKATNRPEAKAETEIPAPEVDASTPKYNELETTHLCKERSATSPLKPLPTLSSTGTLVMSGLCSQWPMPSPAEEEANEQAARDFTGEKFSGALDMSASTSLPSSKLSEHETSFSFEEEAPGMSTLNDSLDLSLDSQGMCAMVDSHAALAFPSPGPTSEATDDVKAAVAEEGHGYPVNVVKGWDNTMQDSDDSSIMKPPEVPLNSPSAWLGDEQQSELQGDEVQGSSSSSSAQPRPAPLSDTNEPTVSHRPAIVASALRTPTKKKRRGARVSFKETPEEFHVIVDENEHRDMHEEAVSLGDGPLPADMSTLLAHYGVGEEGENDWDSDEEAPVILSDKAKEASGWDSDDDEVGQPLDEQKTQDACGAPQQPASAFVAKKLGAAPAVSELSATGHGELDDLVNMVMGTGAPAPAPFKSSGGSGFVPGLHCTGCDFQIMRIEGYIWEKHAGYMFFRNNYPNVMRLRKHLTPQKECCAFCCQCTWKSADATAEIADVAEGLRWKMINSA